MVPECPNKQVTNSSACNPGEDDLAGDGEGNGGDQDILLLWVATGSTLSAARRGSASRRWPSGCWSLTGSLFCQPTCLGPCCVGSYRSLTPSTKIQSTRRCLPSSCTRISSRRLRCASRRR